MSWTDERIETLKKLWTDGLSASQIAAELGMVTRNAVIGKVHRLGLAGRAKAPAVAAARPQRKPVSSGPRVSLNGGGSHGGNLGGGNLGGGMGRSIGAGQMRGATALKMSPQPQEEMQVWAEPVDEDVVVPMSQRVTIMELKEGLCKWPMGDPTQEEFRYCGSNCDIGTPYCTYHARVAYQPPSDRRRHDRRVMSRI